jgi:hypothetical protein
VIGDWQLNSESNPEKVGQNPVQPESLADEILNTVSQKCENPGQAFVLLQQLSIFVWDQYKIDWNQAAEKKSLPTRKSRYLDYLSELLDTLNTNKALVQKID